MAYDRLEEHFDFLAPDDIRLKGHRIGIEHVLYPYVYEGCAPEQILERLDTLTLDEVAATIAYYHQNEDSVGRYLADWLEWGRERRAEQAADRSLDDLRETGSCARQPSAERMTRLLLDEHINKAVHT